MAESPQPRGVITAGISDGLIRLHKRYYGKGPTKAKTYVLDDTVVCMLRDGLTTVESTLLAQGTPEPVHDMRRSFQVAMEGQFTAVVEEATGRSVIAYMSQVHTDPDISLEIFVLEPNDESFTSEPGAEQLLEDREDRYG